MEISPPRSWLACYLGQLILALSITEIMLRQISPMSIINNDKDLRLDGKIADQHNVLTITILQRPGPDKYKQLCHFEYELAKVKITNLFFVSFESYTF